MRSTNCPPCCRTKARLNNDMYAVPTCGSPVGEGATRKRTSGTRGTAQLLAPHDLVAQSSDALDLDGDLVADLHRPDTGRRTGEDDVAGQQRHARRDVGDQARDLVHDLAGPSVLLGLTGQRRGDPKVRRVGVGLDPRTQWAERVV